MPRPTGIRVRMYQVGFGDCFMLSFDYARALDDGRSERHVLIDFGSTRAARRGASLEPIARLIGQHSGGLLDAVVVTHRHQDHLSAFGQPAIAKLLGSPSLVVRSWTENPKAPKDAESAKFVAGLRSARAFTDKLMSAINDAPASVVGDELKRLAADQISNAKAVRQLEKWANSGAAYVHYGQSSGLEDLLPGVRVRVLGPPTIEQHAGVQTQRDEDPDEFWMLYRKLLGAASGVDGPTPSAVSVRNGGGLGPAAWLIERMGRQQSNSFLRIVRILDSVLNNTSVILLFEVPSTSGTKRLLFAGDAQIENWEYALKLAPDAKKNLRTLSQVDLYKVGHHGSRNATPRTLFNLWQRPDTAEREMVAMMSTKSGVHGKHAETAVPRKTLVDALKRRMTLLSTEDFAKDQDFVEVAADLTNGGRFVTA